MAGHRLFLPARTYPRLYTAIADNELVGVRACFSTKPVFLELNLFGPAVAKQSRKAAIAANVRPWGVARQVTPWPNFKSKSAAF